MPRPGARRARRRRCTTARRSEGADVAYMDDMALEREKSKQAMLAGKTPLLGADTSAALHELGVSLGIVPKGTPPSQISQLAAGLMKGPGRVKVDEAKPLNVQPLVG